MANTDVMNFIVNNLSYLVGILGVLVIIMYLLIINLIYNLNYMKKRYKKMMTGVDGANRVAIVRFRAFEVMGSDLSYAVAMLDSHNNGVVLSSIFAREDSRSYAKPIVNGTSTYAMTKEEEEALHQAMSK